MNAWGINLHNDILVSEVEWGRLRRETYARAHNRCEVCWGKGERHPVECHEQWHFDESTRVQTLRGLVALCPTCHAATHYGFSTKHNPFMDDALLRYHLANINGWELPDVDHHIKEAYAACKRLNDVQWGLNLTLLTREYGDLLNHRTVGSLEQLHRSSGHPFADIPWDVPQPKRDGKLLPSSTRMALKAALGIDSDTLPQVRQERTWQERPCSTPRTPEWRAKGPWVRTWVPSNECEEVLLDMLGVSQVGHELRAMLRAKAWNDGWPMHELRKEALDWVLAPLVAEHAGHAAGFLDALENSALVPIASPQADGTWHLEYGLKAEVVLGITPADWVVRPGSDALGWHTVRNTIGFDDRLHSPRLEAWCNRYDDIKEELVVRRYELAIHDSAYIKP